MTDRHDEPRDAHDLADQVSELGATPEDALQKVAEHNDSLEERLPDENLGRDAQVGDTRGGDTRDDGTRDDDEVPRGEGAPGQG